MPPIVIFLRELVLLARPFGVPRFEAGPHFVDSRFTVNPFDGSLALLVTLEPRRVL